MGGSTSKVKLLNREKVEEYVELTYLKKSEINELLKKFAVLVHADNSHEVFNSFVSFQDIINEFPQLKVNPFGDRILKKFSSAKEGSLSFDDLLDLFSVMSKDCPSSVKASWAFRIFDFNEDNLIDKEDILCIIDRLILNNNINDQEKELIAIMLLKELDLEASGEINQLAFEHGIGKLSEFSYSFSFNI